MVYGRIGFAILEDRKFKSGPEGKVSDWPGRPDHRQGSQLDPASVDKEGLVLLGQRQLKFLRHFAGDWKGTDLKVALSQTIFATWPITMEETNNTWLRIWTATDGLRREGTEPWPS